MSTSSTTVHLTMKRFEIDGDALVFIAEIASQKLGEPAMEARFSDKGALRGVERKAAQYGVTSDVVVALMNRRIAGVLTPDVIASMPSGLRGLIADIMEGTE